MSVKRRKIWLTSLTALTYVSTATACSNSDKKDTQTLTPPIITNPVVKVAEQKTPVIVAHEDKVVDEAVDQAVDQAWDLALKRYIIKDPQGLNRFAYGKFAASPHDRKLLKDYIAHLSAQDPDAMSPAQATVFWSNLYNAVTVDLVIESYPLQSIKKLGLIGPWDRKLITVKGKKLSLNDIEHGILRQKYPSPLVHYMVNCASVGCPNLKDGIWKAETLEADRDTAAREFINSPRGAIITPEGLIVSSIYKWFQEDFGNSKDTVVKHLRQYADPTLAQAIDNGAKISKFDYNWTLNE